MTTRYFALILGVVYLLIGVMGLIPGLITPVVQEGVTIETLSGNLLGIFPVNIVHTLVHLVIGVWGLVAYRSFDAARTYSRVIGVLFGVLFLMGMVPGLNTLFGLAPLHGADIFLHLITSALGLYFGFVHRRTEADRPTGAGLY